MAYLFYESIHTHICETHIHGKMETSLKQNVCVATKKSSDFIRTVLLFYHDCLCESHLHHSKTIINANMRG